MFTRTVVISVTVLRYLFSQFEKDVVVVEDGGKASVYDFWRHGSVGQQQTRSKILVLARF